MRVGITGHQKLVAGTPWTWVSAALTERLHAVRNLTGISSLAIGADQLFAKRVLDLGGQLIAVLPFPEYARTFTTEADRVEYDRLLSRAAEVIVLDGDTDDDSSFLAAGMRVVRECDLLFAVWDGKPAKGKGGTADAVAFARSLKKRVVRFDPYAQRITELL